MRRSGRPVALPRFSPRPRSRRSPSRPAPLPPVSDVQVASDRGFEAKADVYGQRDLDMLGERPQEGHGGSSCAAPAAARPRRRAAHAVDHRRAPDHPTMTQLGDQPGLDYMRSVGSGRPRSTASRSAPDGSRRLGDFANEQTSCATPASRATWGDAENTFDWFAREYAAGTAVAAGCRTAAPGRPSIRRLTRLSEPGVRRLRAPCASASGGRSISAMVRLSAPSSSRQTLSTRAQTAVMAATASRAAPRRGVDAGPSQDGAARSAGMRASDGRRPLARRGSNRAPPGAAPSPRVRRIMASNSRSWASAPPRRRP